jgi:hypothetical protein
MAFELILRDDTDAVNFLGTAYRLRDKGLDIWTPKKKQVWGGESVYSHGSQLVTSTFENRRMRMWFQITGTNRDEIAANVSKVERILENARQRSIEQTGSRVEIQYRWDGASNATYFEVIDGELRWPRDTMSVEQVHQTDESGKYIITDFYLALICAPFAYPISPVNGSPTELPLTNGNGTDQTGGLRVHNHDDVTAGHDNWVQIDGTDFDGDFPAKIKMILESEAGEAEKTGKIYIGVRKGDLTFEHILEDDDVSGTSRSTTVDSALADDGGSITDETTEANEATADDMTLLPAAPAVDDAYYFGKDLEFDTLSLNVSTAGVGSWTIVWEYWDGDSWELLAGISDGTTGFTTGGTNDITWTIPTDWATRSIDQIALSAAIADDGGSFTDETTPANEATADDMTLLPAAPVVDDAYYFGASALFDKLTLNISTAGAGTWTLVWEYWNGTAWTALTGISDGTTGFTTGGTNDVVWTPPTDWATTTVNAQGPFYYIRGRVSAFTSITTQPLGQQGWIVPQISFFVRARVSVYTSITTQPLGQQVTVGAEITDGDNSSGGSYTEVSFKDTDGDVDIFEWALTAAQVEATQGPFRFFGRCQEATHWDQNGSYSIVIKYGTDVLFQSEWRKPVDTTTELLDFGTIYLPPWLVGTPTGLAGLNIAIRAKRDVAGTSVISFDYLALMPQDGGYRILEYRATGVAQFEETVDDGWEESVYHIDGSSKKTGLPFGLMPRLELEPGVDHKIFFLQEGTVKNCEITREMDVQVFVVPTYNVLV